MPHHYGTARADAPSFDRTGSHDKGTGGDFAVKHRMEQHTKLILKDLHEPKEGIEQAVKALGVTLW